MKTKIYRNWKHETGNTREVELLHFLQYFRTTNGEVLTFEVDGVSYIGEVWICLDENKKKARCIIRSEEDPITEFADYNLNPIDDNLPNPIVDPIETVFGYLSGDFKSHLDRNVSRFPNIQLQEKERKENEKNVKLRNLLKTDLSAELIYAIRKLLLFRQSPSLRNMNLWKKVDQDSKNEIIKLLKTV